MPPALVIPRKPVTKPVNVRLSAEDCALLEKLARANKCTVSAVLRALIAEARTRAA